MTPRLWPFRCACLCVPGHLSIPLAAVKGTGHIAVYVCQN
jgi:hypothetical protein